MWSLTLVMSECSLIGRGQGHANNFYIVDLENFATASLLYSLLYNLLYSWYTQLGP